MKRTTHVIPSEATPQIEIVTALVGRNLNSMPRSKRKAAKKAVKKQLKKPLWADAHRDPEVMSQQAHIASNSRRRKSPTRADSTRRAIKDSE